jgi:hypothetical protein
MLVKLRNTKLVRKNILRGMILLGNLKNKWRRKTLASLKRVDKKYLKISKRKKLTRYTRTIDVRLLLAREGELSNLLGKFQNLHLVTG